MEKAIILASGGPDSATVMGWAVGKFQSRALHFDYGQLNAPRERVAAKKIANHYDIPIEVADISGLRDVFLDKIGDAVDYNIGCWEVLPFMLGFPISLAASYGLTIGAKIILIGVHATDVQDHPEYRVEALDALAEAIRVATQEDVRIVAPFIKQTKTEVIRFGSEIGLPYAKSWSCLIGGIAHCGRCWGCARRKLAFQEAGVPDPTEYECTDKVELKHVDLKVHPSRRGLLFPQFAN